MKRIHAHTTLRLFNETELKRILENPDRQVLQIELATAQSQWGLSQFFVEYESKDKDKSIPNEKPKEIERDNRDYRFW